jgi:hypothetical protein
MVRNDKVSREIFKDISQFYDDTAIQALAHSYAAEKWGSRHLILGLTITALSAAISASIFSNDNTLSIAAGIISLILVITSSVATFLNPEQTTNAHFKAKLAYQTIADKAYLLYRVDYGYKDKPISEICEPFSQLIKEKDDVRKISPRIPIKYLRQAHKEWERTVKHDKPTPDI